MLKTTFILVVLFARHPAIPGQIDSELEGSALGYFETEAECLQRGVDHIATTNPNRTDDYTYRFLGFECRKAIGTTYTKRQKP